MKKLVLIAIMSVTVTANVVCEKDGRFWYPKNDKAIKIAKMLRVKTCTGKRFKEVVKQLKLTSNVTSSKRYDVNDVVKLLGK